MQNLHRFLSLSRFSASLINRSLQNSFENLKIKPKLFDFSKISGSRLFAKSSKNGGNDAWDQGWDNVQSGKSNKDSEKAPWESPGTGDSGWDSVSSWSTGLTEEHFDGQAIGRQVIPGETAAPVTALPEVDEFTEAEKEYRRSKAYVDSWGERMKEIMVLMKQVREPGCRGSYLKDSEKSQMYRLHKQNTEVYTVERLAKDYRIMRQRVHAILWLKELEEEEEKKLGHPLDDSIEVLLDPCPEFFKSNDKEFHVASLPYKPDFKVMPEGWDGTTRDPDEVLYEISMKEDEMLYQEFVQRMNFNKKKVAGEVKCHKYSRRRSPEGWKITVEKLGARGKRGGGGGWKFVSLPDGSSRALNELEKMFVRRETPRRRRRILP